MAGSVQGRWRLVVNCLWLLDHRKYIGKPLSYGLAVTELAAAATERELIVWIRLEHMVHQLVNYKYLASR